MTDSSLRNTAHEGTNTRQGQVELTDIIEDRKPMRFDELLARLTDTADLLERESTPEYCANFLRETAKRLERNGITAVIRSPEGMEERVANVRERILTAQLAECFRLAGADFDGDEDWRLAARAVEAVRQLRADYDDACDAAFLKEARKSEADARPLREVLAEIKADANKANKGAKS